MKYALMSSNVIWLPSLKERELEYTMRYQGVCVQRIGQISEGASRETTPTDTLNLDLVFESMQKFLFLCHQSVVFATSTVAN